MEIFLICPVAFLAGFVDAVAGGGGLIQVPGLLFLFPNLPLVTLLGTNKLVMSSGTVVASFHYVRAIKINLKEFLPTLLAAFLFAIIGAHTVSIMHNEILRLVVLVLLIVIGIYTLSKKNFGLVTKQRFKGWRLRSICILLGASLGFYDGFFGPGTGSLLIFFLVSLVGYDFLKGSAFAKLINLASNLAALLFFAVGHHVLYKIALPMMLCNILGSAVGAKLAINRGSNFIRWIFLLIISLLIIKFLHSYF